MAKNSPLTMMMAFVAIITIYFIARSMAKSTIEAIDSTAKDLTQPIGETLSDITSSLNGHSPVELTALVIEDHHINWDYTLKSEAERVFWKIPEYQSVLYKLFGAKGRPMKPQYRHLVGRPLTKDVI
ncbi:hypothetical protein L1D54_22520 [Vibrio brasiliensis]|uniref:hypothetical protein n=1 Tax=Vibrio brasiliensis TaxID=170652 RepID=UPI001EFDD5D7|nr:hypothetical protein [Vibrio brasiliensis]MCG9753218.1 hypothetical protein [Vibrio brasiliensis]